MSKFLSLSSDCTNPSVKSQQLKLLIFDTSPKGEALSVSEAEGFPFLCNFQICSFIVLYLQYFIGISAVDFHNNDMLSFCI